MELERIIDINWGASSMKTRKIKRYLINIRLLSDWIILMSLSNQCMLADSIVSSKQSLESFMA